MPRNGASASEMLDSLKARLGFNRGNDDYSARNGDSYADDYDDYGEYDEYADYGEYGYTEDEPVGGFKPATTTSSYTSRYTRESSPSLVSINDVKASTRTSDVHVRETATSQVDTYTTRTGQTRSVIDNTAPAPSSPAHTAATRQGRSRSEGLDSLFEPSTNSYDQYGARSAGSLGGRQLKVVKPIVYGDVEHLARTVKAGDVAVLVMRNTPDDLVKRIVDFSCGVASALDARIECPGERVYAIALGNGLTETEKRNLRNQGAL